jgi:hypothetical protein
MCVSNLVSGGVSDGFKLGVLCVVLVGFRCVSNWVSDGVLDVVLGGF